MKNGWKTVTAPDAAFAFLPFTIQQKGGVFRVNPAWNISAQVARATVLYVSKTGNNTNGLSWATAYNSVLSAWAVLAATDNACVYVGAGKYGWSDGGFNDTAWARTGRSLIGVGGEVIFDAYLAGSAWALEGGTSFTYKSTFTAPIDAVIDYGTRDANNDPTAYTLVANAAAVDATAGTYFYDSVPKVLYVHTLENNSPDADVRPQYSGASTVKIAANNITVYLENIKCYHARIIAADAAIGNTGKIYLKNVHHKLMGTGKNLAITGYTAILQGCEYAHSISDMLTGNVGWSGVAKIVEISCKGWDVGVVGNSGLNATTNHGAGLNVVVNGEYYNCYGPNLAFIQTGKAWLLGTNSHDCNMGSGASDGNFYFDENAWLDTCISSGSTYDIIVDAGHTAYIRNLTGIGSYGGAGTVTTY